MAITQGFAGSGGGGGGGGAVTLAGGSVSAGAYVLGSILDGAIVTLGALGDTAVGDASGSLNAHTRQIAKLLGAGIALGAGAAVIGAVTQSGTWNVTVNTALPAGSNSIGTVVLGTGAAVVGAVTQSGTWNVTVNTALPAGANAIGTVGVTSLPALPAGANSIGTVVLGAGAAVVGAVTQSGTWNVTVNTALPTGTNTIGAVTGPGAAALATDRTTAGAPFSNQLSDGSAFYVGAKTGQLPSALISNRLDVNLGAAPAALTVGAPLSDRTGSTSITASAQSLAISTQGCASAVFQVVTNGSFSGSFTPQVSNDGVTWLNGYMYRVSAAAIAPDLRTGPFAIGSNATEFYVIPCGGYNQVRLLSSSVSAGSAAVNAEAGAGCLYEPVGLHVIADSSNPTVGARVASSYADGLTALGSLYVISEPTAFNGTNLDRHRNNLDVTLLASAARTTTQGPTTLTTYNLGAIIFVLDVTSAGTGSVTLTINEVDPASGKSILLLSGAAVTTNSTNVYTIDPMLTAAANSIAKNRITRTLSWTVTANNANPATYSLGAMEQVS